MARIRVRALRLLGVTQDYEVRFSIGGRDTAALAVIAGEISTGKSSILELIDWCLGASDHPKHPEIAKTARSALLELDLRDAVAVIERPLFTTRAYATVHYTSLEACCNLTDQSGASLSLPAPKTRSPTYCSNN